MDTRDKPKLKSAHQFLKYSGLAFQLLGVLAFMLFLGQYIDGKLAMETPIASIVLLLVGFIGVIYKLIIDLSK